MAGNEALQPIETFGRLAGFRPLLRRELRKWWQTHSLRLRSGQTWWVQALLWLVIANGFLAVVLFVIPRLPIPDGQAAMPGEPLINGLQAFFQVGGMALSIGVIILAQDEIIGEKQSGTAEWLLSKPVARPAFLLAKLAAHGVAILFIMLGLQGAVAYALLSTVGQVDVPRFLAGLGALGLHLLFYLTLALLAGVVAKSRGPVLAITFGSLLGGQVLAVLKPLVLVTPWKLLDVGAAIAVGAPLSPELAGPIVATAAWCVLFVAAMIWQFERLEF